MTGSGTITKRSERRLLDNEREAQLAAALARCAAGDRAALQMIYAGEAPRMIGVARRILLRQDLAEEAVHDAFMRIWRSAAGFDPHRGSARGWLYAIVRNRALSIHRNEHRYDASVETALEIDCEATMTRLPETSALRRCLERIDRPRRDVVVLAYAHGMSHGELAGRMKVPLGTVKSWVRRGLFSLQECMG
ncbi:sigma-70 family RNA polymerase sigma factor [Tardiphaga sp. vice352]|uniref:sigma-70 family RNA polymerase sigma factor n=1 Tax=unclassified Tardiphaga TaxID=2631404 RepID=UPI001163C6BB|nr:MULTISPECIES: sigma-70 family RNA polymerase sigma factor [unclassified Tardiphaga]QDM18265.1 sigma-70 family RNA polymerase sigma factor [Tardiphaga sp. vice278]QDM23270.1 sigma-70 family RNA polymerase sigma factor [Tardiphaga sp. vice154]QDM28491.1 sigma-70 family RNA polymerase sigma factor [Tardiphaga sp. vice304]QDM33588.1 sigma-70 family RNA polymerase sigma factor [Tardiphaga sp. vice352]